MVLSPDTGGGGGGGYNWWADHITLFIAHIMRFMGGNASIWHELPICNTADSADTT